jgi:hypothetical protein
VPLTPPADTDIDSVGTLGSFVLVLMLESVGLDVDAASAVRLHDLLTGDRFKVGTEGRTLHLDARAID